MNPFKWHDPRKIRKLPEETLQRFMAVANAAYMFDSELSNPAPCHIMRNRYREELAEAIKAMPYEERSFVKSWRPDQGLSS